MKIYNTLTHKKQEFIPIDPPNVKMYACGITVSGEAHLGHFLQALIFDIIRKYLEKKGFSVTYARNYTDIDDKIILKANELGIEAKEYAETMMKKIDQCMDRLQVDPPNIWLKATCSTSNIIEFINKLIVNGNAYTTELGDVYFSVDSFKEYGKLSNRNMEDAIHSVRIESDPNKRNPLDFALWKAAKPGEPSWASPWGNGRPGWHIECSAMNMSAFGEQIDIHGGGRDLIFPHHENEIAQTEALTGKQFAKFWIHNGLIKVNGQKMSKSLGNGITLVDLLERYHPEILKFALLQTSYRNDINITKELFDEAEKHMVKFHKICQEVESRFGKTDGLYPSIDQDFNEAMDDDFNTARAISLLYSLFKEIQQKFDNNDIQAAYMVNQIKKTYSLLGLFKNSSQEVILISEKEEKIPDEIKTLLELRWKYKLEKNWDKADALRKELEIKGYKVFDKKDGYEVKRIN